SAFSVVFRGLLLLAFCLRIFISQVGSGRISAKYYSMLSSLQFRMLSAGNDMHNI
ncbi:unnamed protein product, partial [Ixodes persulcatus]